MGPGLRAVVHRLKRVRALPAINAPLTYGVRGTLRLLDAHSEFAVKHLPHVGVTWMDLPNGRRARLWSQGDDWVSNQVFWRGWDGYETEVARMFWTLAAGADVTLDVGAHVGYYTLLAATANPRSTVYAFEPLPAIFERLVRNVRLNDLQNVVAVNEAAGPFDGEADFFYLPSIIPCSSSLSETFMRKAGETQTLRVGVTRIDTLARDHHLRTVDLVKLDTETTEPEVLAGMTNVLREWKPDIICEVLRDADTQALAAILQPLGYSFYHLTDRGAQRREDLVWHPRWLNYLFSARQRASDDASQTGARPP
jgi:FkbM family methyltransferase